MRHTTVDELAARSPVSVLLADTQPLYRDAVARAIRQRTDVTVVGKAADGREALAAIRRLVPHVAVLDVELPGLSAAAVLNAVTRDQLPTRILLLSTRVAQRAVYDAIEAGAAGYLTKDVTANEICQAIVTIARGEVVLAASAQTAIALEIRQSARGQRPVLDERERAILSQVARGRSTRDIGAELHLSAATVKTHLLRIYQRFGVSDRASAVAEAMRRGLLE
jgi:two-component system nitrate/nitrite response regulator NarL